MFNIKKLINGAVRSVLLNEGLSDVLYHFTSISNGYSICKEDTIYFQSAYAKESDNYDRKRKFYLSCTRLFNSSFGYASKFSRGGVRIKLDGRKLAQKYKGKAINYWNGLNDKYSYYKHLPKNHEEFEQNIRYYVNRFKEDHPEATEKDIQHFINHNFNTTAQKHIDNETEDRILSYEPSITNAHEYILSVDVLIPDLKTNEKSKKTAYSFLYNTQLRKLVRIFDSVDEFNNLNGKCYTLRNVDEFMNGEFFDRYYENNEEHSRYTTKDALKYVLLFMSYANHDFDGKNFGGMASKLLQKYNLTHYSNEIGKIVGTVKTWDYTLRNIGEHLNNLRRDLSDKPNRDNSNILKMLTDYLLSIGANSFREGYQIKDKMADEYYSHGRVTDRINTDVKKDFIIINNCLIVDPTKETFADLAKYVLRWDDEGLRYNADSLAYEIASEYSEGYTYNKEKTKNFNSMFQYIYKLFRKGTIQQVLQTLDKMDSNNALYDYIGLNVKHKQMDYWDATRYATLNVYKYENTTPNYDYMKGAKIRDKDVEKVFPLKKAV